jgi:hypothetical protein
VLERAISDLRQAAASARAHGLSVVGAK